MLSKSTFEPTSNTLSIGLLAAAFFPVALIIFDRLAPENLLSILEKSQSVGNEGRYNNSGWQNHRTYPLGPNYKINEEQIHSDRKVQSESKVSCRKWQKDPGYSLGENYQCAPMLKRLEAHSSSSGKSLY